ncbi:MAG: hypothetical protein IRZ31_21105 [Thermogemmatispora sp.]|nr:hypothetical protein [Thermogemmatispora sp.]
MQKEEGRGGEAEVARLVLAGGPGFAWLLGPMQWVAWPSVPKLGPDMPQLLSWLWRGVRVVELVLAGAFVTGLLVLELRMGWRLMPGLVRQSRWVLPRWWRGWRASRGGARSVGSLVLWLLAIVMGVGGSLWLQQGLLWRLSLSALQLGLGALSLRLLVWFTCGDPERRARFWPLSRVGISVLVLGTGGFFALAMVQIWFDLWPARVELALPGGGWQVVMVVLLLRLALWCFRGASGRSWS